MSDKHKKRCQSVPGPDCEEFRDMIVKGPPNTKVDH